MDFEGFGQWKGRNSSKGRERLPLALKKEKEQEKMVRSSQDKQTRRRFKVGLGIAGNQVITRRIAGQRRSSRVKDNRILLERETMSAQVAGGRVWRALVNIAREPEQFNRE